MSNALRLQKWSVRDRLAIDDLAARLRAAGTASVAPDRLDVLRLPDEPTELERARTLFHHRRLRSVAFSSIHNLFHDPAWDMILGLFIAHEEGVPVSLGEAAALTGLTRKSGERWVRALEEECIVKSRPGDDGNAPTSVGLATQGIEMMTKFLAET